MTDWLADADAPRCECTRGPHHDTPCPEPATRTVRRNGVVLHVCHRCTFPGDIDLDTDDTEAL